MRALILAAVAACATAPHGPAIPPLPGKGGPAWTEVTSPHFVLWTDASVTRGKELVQRMELHRQVVLRAMGQAPSDDKIFVLALRDADEVHAYVPPQFAAFSWGVPNPAWRPMIVLAADTPDEQMALVTHELTHVVSFGFLHAMPQWFSEGLAGYFATAKIYGDHGDVEVELGHPQDYVVRRLQTYHLQPVAALFHCTVKGCMDDGFYDSTWALFSYLANTHVDALLAYVELLQTLPPAQHAAAWQQAAPALTPELLDRGVAEWLAHGQIRITRFHITVAPAPVTTRAISDAEVLAARAVLRWHFDRDHHGDETRTAIDAAIAADRTSVLAQMSREMFLHAIDLDDAKATAAAHPDDWRAWWLVGRAAKSGPDADDARAKLCALMAHAPVAGLPEGLCK